MPRLGSGEYYLPPGTEAAPDTTVESARYNVFTADVENEFNLIHAETGGVNDPVTGLPSKVSKAGDTMTGPLVLPAAAPTLAAHATNKAYVDAGDATAAAAANNKVAKAGDTMSGALTINALLTVKDDIYTMRGASTSGVLYLGNNSGTRYLYYDGTRYTLNGAPLGIGTPAIATDAARVDWVDTSYMPRAGGIFTGNVTVNGVLNAQNGVIINAGQSVFHQTGNNIAQGSGGPFWVQADSGQAMITFHNSGTFAGNFGMDTAGNFYIGGWSFGAGVAYQVWTSRDFSAPVTNGQFIFAGQGNPVAAPGYDPFSGGVITGISNNAAEGGGLTYRWRYLQLLRSGSWFTVGYTS